MRPPLQRRAPAAQHEGLRKWILLVKGAALARPFPDWSLTENLRARHGVLDSVREGQRRRQHGCDQNPPLSRQATRAPDAQNAASDAAVGLRDGLAYPSALAGLCRPLCRRRSLSSGWPGCSWPLGHCASAAHAVSMSAFGATTSTASICDPFEVASRINRPHTVIQADAAEAVAAAKSPTSSDWRKAAAQPSAAKGWVRDCQRACRPEGDCPACARA